jgi:N utilization substance protein A
MKGSRVQAVVQELKGEKIDIVTWDHDQAKFICNALAPAEITRVVVDEANRSMTVVVPDDQLSLAIGRRGQNVRLASKISGWNLDVVSETEYNKDLKESYNSLLSLDGVGEATATHLYQESYRSFEDVAKTTVDELSQVKGISKEKAEKLIEDAKKLLQKNKVKEENIEEGEVKLSEEDVTDGEV